MLGDAGRSFVVGYGKDPPERAHHRGASCRPGDCSGAQLATPEPNPNIIKGALVGGAHNEGHFLCSPFLQGLGLGVQLAIPSPTLMSTPACLSAVRTKNVTALFPCYGLPLARLLSRATAKM